MKKLVLALLLLLSINVSAQVTNFNLQASYVSVRTPTRTVNQPYYEFWDSNIGWAGITCGKVEIRNSDLYVNNSLTDGGTLRSYGHYMDFKGTSETSYAHRCYRFYPSPGSAGPTYSYLKLYSGSTAGSFSENVSIASSGSTYFNGGNVGIGTFTPRGKLHISGGDLVLQNESTGYPILWLKDVSGNKTIRLDYNSLISQGDPFYLRSSNIILNDQNGNVLIGKTAQIASETKFRLDVNGPIRANEIVVNTTGADFVFEPTYKLRTLSELETFIKEHKHLPDIAPAKEMQENGVSAGEMQTKLLQKVEELTLYIIELKNEKDKQIADLKREIETLKQNQ